jgi:hypothetical protein
VERFGRRYRPLAKLLTIYLGGQGFSKLLADQRAVLVPVAGAASAGAVVNAMEEVRRKLIAARSK